VSLIYVSLNIVQGFPIHCIKKFAIFPSQAGMSLTKLSLGGKNEIIPAQEEFDL
jgi:hypothetical protein